MPPLQSYLSMPRRALRSGGVRVNIPRDASGNLPGLSFAHPSGGARRSSGYDSSERIAAGGPPVVSADDRRYRVGGSVDDLCRACKIDRRHTVMTASPEGRPLRVVCDYCGSHHNYRGGASASRAPAVGARTTSAPGARPFETVSERERSLPRMHDETSTDRPDLELLLRRVIREEAGLTPVAPADKWHGGDLVLRPGREGLQEKTWPIETFFHKIVMLRNRLRVLEQQINGSELSAQDKLKLQGYVTACYGSLTSFNVLFADEDDRFRGSGGRD